MASINLLYLILEKELQVGKPVIIEANFKSNAKASLNKLISSYSAEVLEYHCVASFEVLSERVKVRAESGERHPGHDKVLMGKIDSESMKALKIGEMVEVDANDFSKINYSELLEKGNIFLNK